MVKNDLKKNTNLVIHRKNTYRVSQKKGGSRFQAHLEVSNQKVEE